MCTRAFLLPRSVSAIWVARRPSVWPLGVDDVPGARYFAGLRGPGALLRCHSHSREKPPAGCRQRGRSLPAASRSLGVVVSRAMSTIGISVAAAVSAASAAGPEVAEQESAILWSCMVLGSIVRIGKLPGIAGLSGSCLLIQVRPVSSRLWDVEWDWNGEEADGRVREDCHRAGQVR